MYTKLRPLFAGSRQDKLDPSGPVESTRFRRKSLLNPAWIREKTGKNVRFQLLLVPLLMHNLKLHLRMEHLLGRSESRIVRPF